MFDYADIVNAAFVSRYSDGKNLTGAQRMNLRHDLAKSMLHRQYSHLITDLEKKSAAQHSVEREEWNMILQDISLAEDVSE